MDDALEDDALEERPIRGPGRAAEPERRRADLRGLEALRGPHRAPPERRREPSRGPGSAAVISADIVASVGCTSLAGSAAS